MKAASLTDLSQALQLLWQHLTEIDREPPDALKQMSSGFRDSARNLLHYVALRRHDLRDLQERLASLGLSSLGRSEACTLANLEGVLKLISLLQGCEESDSAATAISHATARKLLEAHTRTLLGPPPALRQVRIMVTMPGEAADDAALIRDLLSAGMDCLRINCTHDDADAWSRMIVNLRRAEKDLGRKCKVLMDLGGPKLRTGPMLSGPKVVKWRPKRDALGRVEAPARIWLTAIENQVAAPADAVLPVPAVWLSALRRGDHIRFRDARGAKRKLVVAESGEGGRWAEAAKTAYVITGAKLRVRRKDRKRRKKLQRPVCIGELPEKPERLRLRQGDMLILTRDQTPGSPASKDTGLGQSHPARIGCTLPEVFADVKPGEAIWFDDGRLGGVVRSIETDGLHLEITQAPPDGAWLGADKGINLPDTAINLPPLTSEDLANLPFIAANADLIGYSFVRDAAGVEELHSRLSECGGANLGVVLKIELRRAFEHLPELLLAAMRGPSLGVMIARGDLAVECGFERLAEVQEEILWLCEAAHVPVIWATQVLENYAKTGFPSRAEITDAAMGERAECVMLNKGPYVREAVRLLDGILRRMEGHQHKKRAMLRRLHVADHFPSDGSASSKGMPASA
jgi:pyruvate kinase